MRKHMQRSMLCMLRSSTKRCTPTLVQTLRCFSIRAREREVKLACDALAESIQAGDAVWFERVLQQLRGVLLERQNDEALMEVAASAVPATSTFPLAAQKTEVKMKKVNEVNDDVLEECPPWLQALRLLEAAAPPLRTAASSRPAASAPPATAAEGYFPATAPVPEEEPMKAYLDRFSSAPSTSVPNGPSHASEPPWAKAIRLLEAVPVGRGDGMDGTATAGGRTDIHSHSEVNVKDADVSLDRGRPVRLRSYQAMLHEAAAQVAPGGSLPDLRPKVERKVPKPEPKQAAPEVSQKFMEVKADKKSHKEDVGVGRGHLVPAAPSLSESDEIEGELRKENLVWSEHEFNDGDQENRRVLRKFTKEFKKMAEETPDGIRNPKLLTAALDLALACVKCYELDKADAIYRRVLGECRRRGMPWDVKCLQDLATLRCKQHRQADAAELLEELAQTAPPHPATFINLGTVYNQLRQYEKAESWFHQAVNLKGGTPERDDVWNLAICKKNMGHYEEALPMLEQALSEFQLHEPHHPVTIAKLHSSLGGCLHDMGRYSEAAEQYGQAYELYVSTVGKSSPLFGGAAEGKAKALHKDGQFEKAFEALEEAFSVHARCDSVQPTPLFECLEMALNIHEQCPSVDLWSFKAIIEDGLKNLELRGQHEDGNAGLVMSRAGKLLSRCGTSDCILLAEELLRKGRELIEAAQDEEVNLAHEILEIDLLLQQNSKVNATGETSQSSATL